MLDVRALAYIAPVAEQEIGPLTPIASVHNAADEDAVLTALFRIYRESLGTLEYSSVSATAPLLHNQTAQLAALTPFSPGAPADDDYFILCDITVRSTSTGQIEHVPLPQYFFDIKPAPMGPVPGTHHTTHENGGMDEVDVTGLSGLLADPQHPENHAPSHQIGGSDPITFPGGSTPSDTVTDETTYAIPPDAGISDEYARGDHTHGSPPAPSPGVTDHGALTGLLDDDHPQYWLKAHIRYEDDFWSATQTTHDPWSIFTISSGTVSAIAGEANHPGILQVTSSVSANSGTRVVLQVNAILIAGGEVTDIIIRPLTLAGTTIRAGFHDTTSVTAPVDGCYFLMDPATALITGRTMNNSTPSTTGTSFQAVTNTWYHLRIVVNSNATRVDFYIFDAAGAQLWTDFLTTNIPTGAGRQTGQGIVATNSGTSAVALVDIDYQSAEIDRALSR